MQHPLVSVIVAVKNGERFLAAALRSVVEQSYRPLEVVVVDGDSTDRTREIAESFPFVRVIAQPGLGIADAYNAGIAAADGEFVAFLSSDDRWVGNKLADQVGYMLKHPDAQYTVGRARFELASGTSSPAGFRPELLVGEHDAFVMETLVAHHRVWATVGTFDARLRLAADVDWFNRARHLGVSMAVLPQVVLHKRIHGANASLDVVTNNRELLDVVKRSIRRQHAAGAVSFGVVLEPANPRRPPEPASE